MAGFKKFMVYMLFLNVFDYALFSFTLWEINPAVWEQGERLGFVASEIVCLVFSFLLLDLEEETKAD